MYRAVIYLFLATILSSAALAADHVTPVDMVAPNGKDVVHERISLNQEYIRYHEEVQAEMRESRSELIDIKELALIHSDVTSVCLATKASASVDDKPRTN